MGCKCSTFLQMCQTWFRNFVQTFKLTLQILQRMWKADYSNIVTKLPCLINSIIILNTDFYRRWICRKHSLTASSLWSNSQFKQQQKQVKHFITETQQHNDEMSVFWQPPHHSTGNENKQPQFFSSARTSTCYFC